MYNWVVNWIDDDDDAAATCEDYWLKNASAAKRLELASQKCAQTDLKLRGVLNATEPEDMGGYIPVRDLLPSAIPEGRVTLLGGAWHPMASFPRARAGTM